MSVKAPNIPLSPLFLYNSGIFYSYFSIKQHHIAAPQQNHFISSDERPQIVFFL